MKYFWGILLLLAMMFSGEQSFATNYAVVSIKSNPINKFHTTEMHYRKMSDDVLVYYERPTDGRLIQGKDDIVINTLIGKLYFDSERVITLGKDTKDRWVDFIFDGSKYYINGNFVVKNKKNNKILSFNYDMITYDISSCRLIVESNGYNDAPTAEFNQDDIDIYTVSGAIITILNNQIIIKEGKYSLCLAYDLQSGQSSCFVQ